MFYNIRIAYNYLIFISTQKSWKRNIFVLFSSYCVPLIVYIIDSAELSINVSKRSSTPIALQLYPISFCTEVYIMCMCVYIILYVDCICIIYVMRSWDNRERRGPLCTGSRVCGGPSREKRHTCSSSTSTTTRWIQLSAATYILLSLLLYTRSCSIKGNAMYYIILFFSSRACVRMFVIYTIGYGCLRFSRLVLKRRKNSASSPIGNKLTVRNFIIHSARRQQ